MKEKKIAREERNQEKLANGDWVMAEFYATWCPHCQRMKPVVEEFKKLMEGTLEVVLVDIDQEPALTDFYTVESVSYTHLAHHRSSSLVLYSAFSGS